MNRKESIRKGDTDTKGKAEGSLLEMRKRDGEFLARLLAHPDTPARLYNTIQSAIMEMADQTKTQATNPRLLPQLYPLMLDELPEGYEAGLRNGLFAAIEQEDDGLVDEIRRQVYISHEAKGGEELHATSSGAWPESEAIARAVVALLGMPGVPDFLIEGMMSLLRELGVPTGATIIDGEGDVIVSVLARVVEHHPALRLGTERQTDLAELISTVLRHPETPAQMRDAIRESMGGFSFDATAPEFIRHVLACQRAGA